MAGPVVAAKLIADVKPFLGAMKKASSSLKQVSGALTGLGVKLLKVSALLVGLAAAVVVPFAQFERKMKLVSAIADETGNSFGVLSNKAKQLGATTLFTAREAAAGMEILAKAGLSTNEILTATPQVLNLASAANLTLAESADIATGIMRGYGKTAEDLGNVNDVLTKTFTSANVTVQDIGETFKLAGPTAKAAGIEFNELNAVIGILGNAAIKGSRAGTTLKTVFAKLLAPTGELKKLLKQTGIEVRNTNGSLRPLADIIDDMRDKGVDAADALRLFGLRGTGMAVLLAKGGDAIRSFQRDLDNAGGTAKRLADVQINTLSGQFTILKSKIESVALDLGERLEPAVSGVIKTFQGLVDQLLGLDDGFKTLVLKGAAVAAAIAGLAGAGLIVAGVLVSLAGFVAVALLLGVAFLPLIGIIGGVVFIVGVFKRAWDDNLGGVQDKTRAVVDKVKELFQKLKDATQAVVDFVKKAFEKLTVRPVEIEIRANINAADPEVEKILRALAATGVRTVSAETLIGLGVDVAPQVKDTFAVLKTAIRPMQDLAEATRVLAAARGEAAPAAAAEADGRDAVAKGKEFALDTLSELKKTLFAGLGVLLPAGLTEGLGKLKAEFDKFLEGIDKGAKNTGAAANTIKDAVEELDVAFKQVGGLMEFLRTNVLENIRIMAKGAAGPLKDALGGALGGVISGAQKGFAATGDPIGAVGGAIASLIANSETFSTLLKLVNNVLGVVGDTLGAFLAPLAPLIDILGMFFNAMVLANPGLILMGIVLDALSPVFKFLFNIVRILGIAMLKVARFFLKLLGKSTRKVDEALEELKNTTFETAGTIDDLEDAASSAAEALFNVPEGVKVAAARFAAQTPDRGGGGAGGGGGGGGGGGLPELEINLFKQLKRAGKFEDDSEKQEILGTTIGAATTERPIIINVNTNDPEAFTEKVIQIMERKTFARRGFGTSSGEFSTSRGSR